MIKHQHRMSQWYEVLLGWVGKPWEVMAWGAIEEGADESFQEALR